MFRLAQQPKAAVPPEECGKTAALIRLHKDLEEVHPLPKTVQLVYPVSNEDPYLVELHLTPDEGMYVGGCFKFQLRFKLSYPIEPPKVRSLQKVHLLHSPIFHPNIDPDGAVCLNILRLDWSPALSLNAIIFGLLLLFYEPDPEEPLNKEAAEVLRADPQKFAQVVRRTMNGRSLDSARGRAAEAWLSMFLYHLTLQKATSIHTAAVGNFTGSKSQEILTVRGGNVLELLKVDSNTGRFKSLHQLDTFSTVRSVVPFRLPGDTKDYVVVGNDSGRITILEYNADLETFEKVHQETFGRSGCRRTIPGQYLAADPRGRAIMVAAVERQKLVYVMNRDPSTTKLTISSPMEAHKASTILFCVVGLDVGFENPMFACLEMEYTEVDDLILQGKSEEAIDCSVQKVLSFYEVDLGLNHTTRKWLEVVPDTAHHILAVPGGNDGPGGVLVCGENQISWHNQGFDSISVLFPSRSYGTSRGTLIACSALVKAKATFFHLLQSEDGDLFKVSIDYDSEGIKALRVRYFDTVAVSNSIAILKSGFLFVPGESANHIVYQIQSLGDYEDEPEYVSGLEGEVTTFTPRALRNLAPTDQIQNFAPITKAKLLNLGDEESPQLYACQGKSNISSFNVIRYGLGINEVASSELPADATGLWTLKSSLADPFNSLLVLSFAESTSVLAVGENIEEVADSGFLNNVKTLEAFQLANDSYVQVHSSGVRQITANRGVSEWKCPSGAKISQTSSNERQLVIFLSSRMLVYFELDFQGNLTERKCLADLPEEITTMYLGPVPHDRQRSRFLAVGSSENVVRMISLDPDDCLEPISLQALAATPSSIVLLSEEKDGSTSLRLEIGLQNGVLVTLKVDPLSGNFSDVQSRYIGSSPISLVKLQVPEFSSTLVLSSRTWIKYSKDENIHTCPLFYEALSHCAPFASESSPIGLVASIGNILKIISFENFDTIFTRHRVPLEATPRKLCFHSGLKLFAIAESDNEGVKAEIVHRIAQEQERPVEEILEAGLTFSGSNGQWCSMVEIFNPFKGESIVKMYLNESEHCTSVSFVNFFENPSETFVAVGIAKTFSSVPRSAECCYINLYRLVLSESRLEFVHSTPLDQMIPSVMCCFAGRLLVGAGSLLRLYDLGRKRLLRKCEAKIPTFITSIKTQGWRIVVGDAHESVFLVHYRSEEGQFVIFADEPQARAVSTLCMLDYDTVAVADRFGNFSVLRLPANISEGVELDGTALVTKRDTVIGAANKLEKQVEYHLGDTIVSLHKTALVQNSREVIHYVTLSGAIGVFIPFASRSDALLLQHLELFMRTEAPAQIAGREHLTYRSSYSPVKGVIDGDLCERFMSLPGSRKLAASQSLDTSPDAIQRRLEVMRSSIGF